MIWGRRAVSVDVWPNAAALLALMSPIINNRAICNQQKLQGYGHLSCMQHTKLALRDWVHQQLRHAVEDLESALMTCCHGWMSSLETVQTALLISLQLIAMCVKHRSYVHFLKVCTSAIGFPIWLTEFNCGDGSRNASANMSTFST